MEIRKAEYKDCARLQELLHQVLEIHARIRPDVFVSGTTKYSVAELEEILKDEKRPVYVAVDESDSVMGYSFCVIKEPPAKDLFVPVRIMFIDDLCVDEAFRGRHVGEALFEHVKEEAKRLGCYEITLNVWRGNEGAERFYEKMGMETKERQMEFILDRI